MYSPVPPRRKTNTATAQAARTSSYAKHWMLWVIHTASTKNTVRSHIKPTRLTFKAFCRVKPSSCLTKQRMFCLPTPIVPALELPGQLCRLLAVDKPEASHLWFVWAALSHSAEPDLHSASWGGCLLAEPRNTGTIGMEAGENTFKSAAALISFRELPLGSGAALEKHLPLWSVRSPFPVSSHPCSTPCVYRPWFTALPF